MDASELQRWERFVSAGLDENALAAIQKDVEANVALTRVQKKLLEDADHE